jgi:hypothetical protein
MVPFWVATPPANSRGGSLLVKTFMVAALEYVCRKLPPDCDRTRVSKIDCRGDCEVGEGRKNIARGSAERRSCGVEQHPPPAERLLVKEAVLSIPRARSVAIRRPGGVGLAHYRTPLMCLRCPSPANPQCIWSFGAPACSRRGDIELAAVVGGRTQVTKQQYEQILADRMNSPWCKDCSHKRRWGSGRRALMGGEATAGDQSAVALGSQPTVLRYGSHQPAPHDRSAGRCRAETRAGRQDVIRSCLAARTAGGRCPGRQESASGGIHQ